jgi:hypothetical protein
VDARVPFLALNSRLGADLARVLLGVDDDRIFYSAPQIDARPIAEVAIHAYSSLLGFTAVVAGVGWPLPWGQRVGALDAIADGLAHGFGHVGNLAGIRAIGGFPTPPEAY